MRLNPEAIHTDIGEFDSAFQAARKADSALQRVQHLTAAIGLYRGELLPGYFEEWIVPRQQQLASRYFEALRHGVFCELGQGCVDFAAVLRWLKETGYQGYTLVEQDVLPGMGNPKDSARRNREYLRSIEHNYS